MAFRGLTFVLLPVVVAAQDTSRTAGPDSLLARIRALEAAVEVVQKQLAEQASTGVQARSRARMELTGRVIVNSFSNDARVNNVDNPQFARPDTATLLPTNGFGMAIRQTSLGLRVFVPDVLGGHFTGDADVDFYGGQQPSSGGRTFPLLRLRTARGTLRWAHGELMAGQEMPLFSPQNPVTLAALGTPGFVTAGNLWLWLPQFRATGEIGASFHLAVQAAVLAPTSGDPAGAFDTDFDAAERSRRPMVESRVRVRWGEDEMAGELGCAGHYGWIAVPRAPTAVTDSLLASHAVGCDARVPFTSWFELRGEAYDGQLTRGLGGGAIGQGVGRNGAPVRNRAAWAQANVKPLFEWSFGAGCGVDDPRDEDIVTGGRLRNLACAGYTILRPSGPLVLGVEYRRIETTYASGRVANNHFNVGVGFEF
jgi:hypothetical protein